jgi:hypothetical protein
MARVVRRLPYPGKVLARKGSRVDAGDTVAQAFVPAQPHVVNLARALALPPARVERALRREVGNKVNAGEVLARSGARVCVAPVGGQIAGVDTETGYVTIAPDPELHELKAAVAGFVMDVQPYEGVTIETLALQVFGVFGLGLERSGVLRLLITDPAEVISADQIDARSRYSVIIGGAGITGSALRRAVEQEVHGVIVGGIEEHELRAFLGWQGQGGWRARGDGATLGPVADPGLTLIVTEGFGTRPMSAPAFEMLASRDGHEVLVEGRTSLRRPLVRPRVVVPIGRAADVQLDAPRPLLRVGASVRLLDDAHLGLVGRVRALPPGPQRVASGALVAAVEVELLHAEPSRLLVPRTAVEVIAEA